MTDATVPGAVPAGLSKAEERFSQTGLMSRYAHGRVGHFWQRQVMTMLGAAALWIVDGAWVGIIAVAVALLGEAVDCIYLLSVPRRLKRGVPVGRIIRVSTLTAGLQAMAISFCVSLAWLGAAGEVSPLFPIAFLTGAVVNAGMILPHHKPAAIARFSVYFVLFVSFFFTGALTDPHNSASYAMNAAGVLILAYMTGTFIAFIARGFAHNRENILRLTEQSRVISETNSELRKREQENRRLSLAIRHANDSVIVFGPDGRISWVNDAFTRITGYSAAEAVGCFTGDLLNTPDTDPNTIAAIAKAVRSGVPFRGEVLNRTKSGDRVWIETNQVPVGTAEGGGRPEMFIAIERDITDARRQAVELAEAKRAAEEGARVKAEFLATMSHEIRTPMNGVIGMSDLLCEGPLTDDQRVYAETIRTSSQALLNILNDVLDLSKLDAGKMQLNPVDFDLTACLETVAQLLQPQAQEKGLWLRTELDENLPEFVTGDDGRIRQVLVNLLGNAVKFTESGGVTLAARAEAHDAGWSLLVSVRDTGIGIPPEKLATVFERFAQADAATTRRFGGTGLGLTISRMLVEAMGGDISVTSDEGKGSCFCLCIPVGRGVRRGVSAESQPKRGMAGLDGLDILVAEDNRVNRLLIEKLLANAPVRLRFAHDGAEAVAQALSDPPDLILMDMSMPRKSGIEATCEIRRHRGPQPVIVALTANAFASDRAACLAAGMDAFLTKPVRRDELIDCLLDHCPPVAAAAQA